MGAHSWVRDNKAKDGRGRSFVAGAAAVIPQQRTKKRKLVWERDATSGASNKKEEEEGSLNDQSSREIPAQAGREIEGAGGNTRLDGNGAIALGAVSKDDGASALLREATKKRVELEARKRALEAKRQKLKNIATVSKASGRQKQIDTEREREERKKRIEAAFASAFEAAKKSADSDIAAAQAPIQFADEKEISRVLHATSDYKVLELVPGVDAAAIRKRYRELAIRLHPDKCKLPGASEAFHRLVKAYQQITKYT